MKNTYPKIKSVLSRRTFNVLITALDENRSDTIPFIAKGAEKLCDKISKYARFFTDESRDECVDIRFYGRPLSLPAFRSRKWRALDLMCLWEGRHSPLSWHPRMYTLPVTIRHICPGRSCASTAASS